MGQGESVRRHVKAVIVSSAFLLLTFAIGVGPAAAEAPVVSIEAPTSISYTSAHVSGKVDPRDLDTSYYFRYSSEPGNPFGWQYGSFQGPLSAGAGETAVSDDLAGLKAGTEYVVSLVAVNADGETPSAEPNPTFTTEPVAPAAVTIDPVTAVTASSAHFSGAIDPEAPLGDPAAFDVQWHFECTPACPGLEGFIAADSVDHTVEADASSLEPGTAYEVTLVAENAGGAASAGPETFTTDSTAPQILSTTASPLRTEATLGSSINPGGLETSYFFEFGPTDSYGQTTETKELDAGGKAVAVTATLFGLSPASGYHYRVVATNSVGTTQGPDQSFTTLSPAAEGGNCPNAAARSQQHATRLADCRAYELVSPAQKSGYPVGGQLLPNTSFAARADGDSAIYTGFYPLPGAKAGSWGGFRATRTSTGWQNEGLLAAPSGYQGPYNVLTGSIDGSLRGTTDDQATVVTFDTTTAPGGSLWLLRPDGTRQRIVDGSNTDGFLGGASAFGSGPGQPWLQAISGDGRHVVFTDSDALLPGLTSTGSDILYEWVDDGSNAGAGTLRVVNRTNSPTLELLGGGAAALGSNSSSPYSRLGYMEASRHAVSSDGSRIFFQTPTSTELSRTLGAGPIFLREDGAVTTEITAPEPGYSPSAPPTLYQYLDAAKDGSAAFFWANGDLTNGAPAGGGIYRFDVETGDLLFIDETNIFGIPPTAVASDDGSTLYYERTAFEIMAWRDGSTQLVSSGKLIYWGEGRETGEIFTTQGMLAGGACPSVGISPDGRYFAFTGGFGNPNGAFLFDADKGELTEVSASELGPADPAPVLFKWTCNTGEYARPMENRVMSDDGSFVFFDTTAALSPEDTNGTWDAYQWHNGQVTLLSPGVGRSPAGFVGTDATGHNAFITTEGSLAPQDVDTDFDIYDARVNGGFFVPPGPPGCDGETCQGAPATAPTPTRIGSAVTAAPQRQKHRKKKRKKRHRHHAGKAHGGSGRQQRANGR